MTALRTTLAPRALAGELLGTYARIARAHINPAATLALVLVLAGRFPARLAVGYVLAPVVGSALAVLTSRPRSATPGTRAFPPDGA
ncbi:aquaporin [Deinococcus pimensis]|uniref:aquaporin n=1 Tax=Deinococcus pimensis TaxID=309888 RepID=UPI0004838E25|nr:aquaporin [Deinococcus pimensis]